MAFYVLFALLTLCSAQFLGSISLSKPTGSSDPCATQAYIAGLPWASGWSAPPLDSCQCSIANLQVRFLGSSGKPIAYLNGVNATVAASTMYGWGLPGVCGAFPTCQAATATYFAGLALSSGAWSSACSGNAGWMCVSSVPNPNTWSSTLLVASQISQVIISGDNRLPTTTVSFYDTASTLMQSAVLYPKDCCSWTFNFTPPTPSSSLTPSRSPSPTPTPCSAPPGSFCSGGSVLICPIGAYCSGGSALNASCFPVTACTVAGLSAQPPCYWNYSVLNIGLVNPFGVISETPSSLLVADWNSNQIKRVNLTTLTQKVVVGSGAGSSLDGVGTAASTFTRRGFCSILYCSCTCGQISQATKSEPQMLRILPCLHLQATEPPLLLMGLAPLHHFPHQIAIQNSGDIVVADSSNRRIRRVTSAGTVTTIAGNGINARTDGTGILASFKFPNGIASNASNHIFVSDYGDCTIRLITPSSIVSTIAGSLCGYTDSSWQASLFNNLGYLSLSPSNDLIVADQTNHRFRHLRSDSTVSTIIGNGVSASSSGIFPLSRVASPIVPYLTADGTLFAASEALLGIAKCVPCPASFYCFSGAPVLCPAGSFCPLSSINATACPSGFFSNAGSSNCTFCPAGTFSSSIGSASCQQCPGGHYCPAGSSSWARLNCGRGNYCPDGSGAPTPCPYQVPPTGGWGAVQVQGPAFLVETARCLNHCFWNFTSGDGKLSQC